MLINHNLVRWIHASVATYLKAACVADNCQLPVIIEGLDDRDDEYMKQSDRGEIRISGPFTKPFGSTQLQALVPANILITSRYDKNKNAYIALDKLGVLLQAMSGPIPVFKYGNGVDDDADEQIGCLILDKSGVSIFQVGQLNTTDKVKQSLIDAKYTGEFDLI